MADTWGDDLDDTDRVAMNPAAFEVRARMAREWVERTVGGPSRLPWTVRWHFEQDVPALLTAIESAYRAARAAPGGLSALERDVIEKAKALVAGAPRSSAPRTPRFQAFIDAVGALTDDPAGSRRWALPDEPGPEVTAVRDVHGYEWKREGLQVGERWHCDAGDRPIFSYWPELVANRHPLTDATPTAEQNGDVR